MRVWAHKLANIPNSVPEVRAVTHQLADDLTNILEALFETQSIIQGFIHENNDELQEERFDSLSLSPGVLRCLKMSFAATSRCKQLRSWEVLMGWARRWVLRCIEHRSAAWTAW